MNKWIPALAIGLCGIMLAVSGCAPKEPIRIGFAGGFTGNNSSVAISGRDAVQMAIEEVNAQGGLLGRQVMLVSKDDKSDPEQTKRVDGEFIQEGIPIVIGHIMSGVAPAMMEAIAGKDILMLSPTMAATSLSDKDDNFLRTILTNVDQGSFLAAYLREKAHKSRLVVLYSNTNKAFVEAMRPAVSDTFIALGGTVVHEAEIREKNTDDMQQAVSEAVRLKADSVVLIMNAGDVAMFSQIMLKENAGISIFSGTWGMTADVVRMGGKAVEGIAFPAQFDPGSTSKAYVEFSKRYQEIYGQPPDFGAVYSYDAAQVVLGGIREAGSTEPDKVKAAIISHGVYHGLQQDFSINADGDCEGAHFMLTVKDGKFVNAETVQ